MKKIICYLMVLALLLAGCGKRAPVETTDVATVPPTTEAPTTEAPTEPVPETAEGVVLADHVPAILRFANRGEQLELVGEYDEAHFVVKTETGYGLVQKSLVHREGETPYKTWTGYSAWNAGIYDNFHLSGEPGQKLGQNTKVEILEDLGTCYLVKTEDGTLGYMNYKQVYQWPAGSGSSGGSSDSGSSSGGSSNGGGDGTGQDGGDISMQFHGGVVPLAFLEQQGAVTGKAEVLADRTPIVLGYFNREETIPVVVTEGFGKSMEGYRLLWWEGIYSYVEERLTRLSTDPAYEPWDGFAGVNPKAYTDFYFTGDPIANVWVNKPVRVLCDLGDVYLVEVNETIGYMAKDQVSETRIPVSNGGGGGDSGSSGGSSAPVQEWSDPVL